MYSSKMHLRRLRQSTDTVQEQRQQTHRLNRSRESNQSQAAQVLRIDEGESESDEEIEEGMDATSNEGFERAGNLLRMAEELITTPRLPNSQNTQNQRKKRRRADEPGPSHSQSGSDEPEPMEMEENDETEHFDERNASQLSTRGRPTKIPKFPGRIREIQIQDFMCHSHVRLKFDVDNYNCFYIVGPNGSGKSAIFAAINMALGGAGRSNERGKKIQSYVKEGARSAHLRIVLTNEGLNSYQKKTYGRAIIIERTFNSDDKNPCNQYVLKGQGQGGREHLVSKRKADLDRILIHFNIQLENPIAWLSQDRSRQFFSTMKPKTLYQLFVEGTMLVGTEESYQKAEYYLKQVEQLIEEFRQEQERKKQEYTLSRERFMLAGQLQDRKRELKQLGIHQLWAPYRDLEEKKNEQKEKINQIEDAKTQLEAKKNDHMNNYRGLNDHRDELREQINERKQQSDAKRNVVKQLMIESNQLKNDVRDQTHSIQNAQKEITILDREYEQTEEQLAKVLGNSDRDLETERSQLEDDKAELERETVRIAAEKRMADEEWHSSEQELRDTKRQVNAFEFELKQLDDAKTQLGKDRAMVRQTQQNHLLLFGENTPVLLQLIAQNRERFEQLPIGPIGNHIGVEDPRWGPAVEYALRKFQNTFIVGSAHDRKMLDTLCRMKKIPVPVVIVTEYSDEIFDTSENEPPQEFPTILRVITAKIHHFLIYPEAYNPTATVYNTLIDNAQIESILLFDDDDEGRRVMSRNPPENVKMAFTRSCSQIFPAMLGRNGSIMKPYRYYACFPPFQAQLFTDQNTTRQSDAHFQARLQDIEGQIRRDQEQLYAAQQKVAVAENKLEKVRSIKQKFTINESDLKRRKDNLQNMEEELLRLSLSGTLIDNFRDSLTENRQQKQRQEEIIAQNEQIIAKLREQITELGHKIKNNQDEIQTIRADITKEEIQLEQMGNEIRNFNDEVERIDGKLARAEKMRDTASNEIDKIEIEQTKKLNEIERQKGELSIPEGMEYPPDMNDIDQTEELEKRIVRLRKAISSIEKGGDIPTADQIKEIAEKFKSFVKSVKRKADIKTRLFDLLEKRYNAFSLLKYALPKRLEQKFIEHMVLRNYEASLATSHDEGTIMIKVSTHNRRTGDEQQQSGTHRSPVPKRRRRRGDAESDYDEDEDDDERPGTSAQTLRRRALQDLQGLSGGERTYTTACFVMALWSFVDSPFRMLDEFDVFMDMYNRRLVMEMFVDFSLDNPNSQSFFFTPQGVKELNRPDVQVFDLPPARNTQPLQVDLDTLAIENDENDT